MTRSLWPARRYVLLGLLTSVLLVGIAAPRTLIVVSVITLCYVYPLHRLTKFAMRRGSSRPVLRLWLGLGIAGLVALLVGFKLYRHFTVPWLGGPRIRDEVLALIGFSYFVFRAISFLHIQSITDIDERNPWPILFYTLFPATLTSGPIQKYQDFKQQLLSPLPLDRSLITAAVYRITRGYFRKLVLAFILNSAVDKLLTANMTAPTSLAVITCLYLYFYFDFAGYSDIAIGYGLLLGIKVPENFKKPFLATTVSEFWRNWHITLVDWFRDQVFIPLGGMHGTRFRAALLALMVMVLCGLWHGLTLSLLAWGCWHGLLLFTEGVSGSKPIPPALRAGPRYYWRVAWTNTRVALGCIFFLPNSDSMLNLLRGLVHWKLA